MKRIPKIVTVNNENPIRNIKNDSNLNRKKNALKVVTNTVQSPKKLSSKKSNMGLKTKKILPMEKFETETKSVSPSLNINYELIEEPGHIHCRALQEKDFLPASMTCNIGMLNDFFSSKNDDENDFLLHDYNNNSIMSDKMKNTFEQFGTPDMEYMFSPLPVMDFPEIAPDFLL